MEPPLPSPSGPETIDDTAPLTGPSLFHQAATLSLGAPLVLIAATIALGLLQGALEGDARTLLILALTWLNILLLVFGFACGLIGLCGIPRYGRDRLLWRSLIGIVIPVMLAIYAISTIRHGLQQAAPPP